jgi:tRNA nucleotidyltransferase (CCA-adding enzyme)
MKTYLVGGAVRDKLLNFPYHEKDWVVVGGTPEVLLEQGFQAVGKDFPVFLHPDTREEYALARTERKIAKGYTGFECFSSPDVSLEEDLERRDLTINAIAEDDQGNLIDPYGGQQDLADKILRHVSEAFSEDPLRILRVARFMARYHHLGFTVAPETLALMQLIASSDELASLPQERIWKELERSLGEKNPEQFFITLQQCNSLAQLLSELVPDFGQAIEIFTHACQQNNNPLIRFSCLLYVLNDQACEQLCKKIRTPRKYIDLALLVNRYGPLTEARALNAAQQLAILEKTDAFRRPERFLDFLTACEILHDNSSTANHLMAALSACKSVDIKSLAEQFTGKEIAAQIQQHRIKAIEELEQP